MCRFLLYKSKKATAPDKILSLFADYCEENRTPDGDRQKDGWGIAWLKDSANHPPVWQTKKFLEPIWQCRQTFSRFPPAEIFAVHSRSASFSESIGEIDYNQPFIKDDVCFVFNGAINGVKITTPLEGKIGSQKLFSLFLKNLKNNDGKKALLALRNIVRKNSREIQGMNIGIISENRLSALCDYTKYDNYFTLQYLKNKDAQIICSGPLPLPHSSSPWQKMQPGEVVEL